MINVQKVLLKLCGSVFFFSFKKATGWICTWNERFPSGVTPDLQQCLKRESDPACLIQTFKQINYMFLVKISMQVYF